MIDREPLKLGENEGRPDKRFGATVGADCNHVPIISRPSSRCPTKSIRFSATSALAIRAIAGILALSVLICAPSQAAQAADATVESVQRGLMELGYDTGVVDGIFGRRTESALLKFQKDHNLPETGKIDRQVRDALQLGQSIPEEQQRRENQTESPEELGWEVHTIQVAENVYFTLPSTLFLNHLPVLGGDGQFLDQGRYDIFKHKIGILQPVFARMNACPDPKAAQENKVRICTGLIPAFFKQDPIQIITMPDAPGTRLTIAADTVIGPQKVLNGGIVSTITFDEKGSLRHSFEGTESNTRVADLVTGTVYEFDGHGRFVPVPPE